MTDRSDTSRVFEALAHPYRRQLLVALLEANPRADDDLDPMGLLAAGETDEPAVTEEGLIHLHLPKLVDMGFIEWDRDAGEISKGPDWETIAPVLQLMHDHREELPDDWLVKSLPADGEPARRRETDQ